MNMQRLDENLIGYLLDAVDDGAKAQVENRLESDPEARLRLEQLRTGLEPLAVDREDFAPPKDLAVRTFARVAEHVCKDRELPRAPVTVPSEAASISYAWWRRADFLVAASIMLMVVGLLVPAIYGMREKAKQEACKENLRQYAMALRSFHDHHGQFPNVAAEHPRHAAGMVMPILVSAGVLAKNANVRCPSTGPHAPCPTTLERTRDMPPEVFFQQAEQLSPCYAYSLGYLDAEGKPRGPKVPKDHLASLFPLMADCLPPDADTANSANHGGKGQNVLFADGSVKFVNTRKAGFGGDDIFRNKADKVGAGLDMFDAVLGHSSAKP
ncbi:MAG: hypothetical protein L0Y72_20525 [Gemmataceae bacterium]|nr:hypothetical protein [Gemmataceae bacterium]MCI0741425.1 hypothetical protein [Gemmataceae bacterium]